MQQTSPFQDINKSKAPEIAPSFSFQTMQGDLLNMPKGALPTSDQSSVSAPTNDSIVITEKINKPIQSVLEEISSTKISSNAANPFLGQTPIQQNATKEILSSIPTSAQKKDFTEIPQTQPRFSAYKIIVSVIITLVVLIIALSIYYFLISSTPQETAPSLPPIAETPVTEPSVPTPPVEQPVIITPPVEKYSPEKPNYLIINPAVMSSDEIKSAILAITAEIKNSVSQSQLPYEFIVVDANNNPISFPIFAITAKLNLSQTLLSSLGDKFSLFIYNDSSNMRLGLAIAAPKTAIVSTELSKQEKTFATDASFLFLDTAAEIKTGTFSTSTYNKTNIKYFNVNQQKNMSIDYALINSQLIIGTSKNTERAIIDKLAAKEVSSADNAKTSAQVTNKNTQTSLQPTSTPASAPESSRDVN